MTLFHQQIEFSFTVWLDGWIDGFMAKYIRLYTKI